MNSIAFFWLLLLLALIFYKLRRKKAFRIFAVAAFLELFLFSATPLPIWMIDRLERKYPVYKPSEKNNQLPILVLGSGQSNEPHLAPLQRLSPPALSRMTEGIRQYRLSPGSKIIFSGYSESGNMPVSQTMALAALSLGVNAKDTLMMTKPSTTWEEALEFKKRFGTSGEFILVTSAAHMPRSMETFRSLGLRPIPAPTHFQITHNPGSSISSWKPSSYKLNFTDIAMHEYGGSLYYKWFKE